jgi:hypothetical protein
MGFSSAHRQGKFLNVITYSGNVIGHSGFGILLITLNQNQ